MKQMLFFVLFATLFIACDNDSENLPDLTAIQIEERPCETLEYVGKIGKDFDTALDSLRKRRYIPSETTKVPLGVLFDYDNRLFYGINTSNECGMYADVLDTKGYYYQRSWHCPDEGEGK